jgi:hypothetical protein
VLVVTHSDKGELEVGVLRGESGQEVDVVGGEGIDWWEGRRAVQCSGACRRLN